MFREKVGYRLKEHKLWEEESKKEDKPHKVDSKDLFKEFNLSEKKEKVNKQNINKKREKKKKHKEISGGYLFLAIILSLIVGSIIGWYFFLQPTISDYDKSSDTNIESILEPIETGYSMTKTFSGYFGIRFEINSNHYKELIKKQESGTLSTTEYLTSDQSNIRNLAKQLENQAQKKGIDPINYIIKFVQDLDYEYDTRTGYDDFRKFPEVTIYEQNGDCEDTSYVLYSLLESLSYDVTVVYIPSHAMVGIACKGGSLCGEMYWTIKNKKYFPIESTGGDGSFGYSYLAKDKSATFVKNKGTENYNELECYQKEIKTYQEEPLKYKANVLDYDDELEGLFNVVRYYTIEIENKDSETGIFEYELIGDGEGGRTYSKKGVTKINSYDSEKVKVKFDIQVGEVLFTKLNVNPELKTVENIDYETHCK